MTPIDIIITLEGGYVNHPEDPGGETKYGITKRLAQRYGYNGAMKSLPIATSRSIYEQEFVVKLKLDQFKSESFKILLLSAAVNIGAKNAVMMLQEIVGTGKDGVIGPATIKAANECLTARLKIRFVKAWDDYYQALALKKPMFSDGWVNRIDETLKYSYQV